MNRHTKIMTALFCALLGYGFLSSVVYPRWIEPLLSIDERIAERRAERDRLEAAEERVELGKEEYRSLVARTGSFDIGKVETDVRARLNELIDEHDLQNASVSPSRPSEDRKTGLTRMVISVTATGTLRSAVEFLEDVAELPQLVRVGSAAVFPASGSGKDKRRNQMNLRVPIELLVLPEQRLVGRIDEVDIVQPESFVRHAGRDYSLIWSKKPFREPIPLRAGAGKDVNKRQDQAVRLKASATGGDGEYSYEWSPATGLSDAMIPDPKVDASEGFARTYTVKITDASGETATDTVKVTIRAKPQPKVDTVADTGPKPPPPPQGPARFRDGKHMQLCMALIHSTHTNRVSELMVSNSRSNNTEYYAVGDEFDGGHLVFVHPRGGLVRRSDDYFIYPIGGSLVQDIKADTTAADDFPELKEAADLHRSAVEAAVSATEAGEKAAPPPVDEVDETEEKAAAAKSTVKSEDASGTGRDKVEAPNSGTRVRPGPQGTGKESSKRIGRGPNKRSTGVARPPADRKKGPQQKPGGKRKPRRVDRRPKTKP